MLYKISKYVTDPMCNILAKFCFIKMLIIKIVLVKLKGFGFGKKLPEIFIKDCNCKNLRKYK